MNLISLSCDQHVKITVPSRTIYHSFFLITSYLIDFIGVHVVTN